MTSARLVPFLFDGEITVRVIDRDNQPWFIAVDVCRALGLGNPTETLHGLDEDERGISAAESARGRQQVAVISESGLYAMIFKSRKPNAARFRKWITSEVLPSLRQVDSTAKTQVQAVPTLARKPYHEWTLEERRTAIAEVNTARRVLNQVAAAWVWEHVGLPVPPTHLLPVWWQTELRLVSSP